MADTVTAEKLITCLAQILAGLQVPLSLGLTLGTAKGPLVAVLDDVGFGWKSEEDFETYLRQKLADA